MALHNKYAPKGYLAINPNEGYIAERLFRTNAARAKEKSFPFPYLYDETQEITKAYGATQTSHLYIVQKQNDGSFKVAYIGTIDDNYRELNKVQKKYAEAALDELVTDKPISQPSTKAIGCTIKWR
ncbi:redoxin domain-containing protein [Pontibacter silvestris]|uniref:Redoxin domain-containing protein n=1 Tax=Pontibacter silvestris TaxID=2305183 RepID=A0ABW4WUB4_9BACT|nr:redoxin domain-containing protein [Pontibacter silvestris]MCC9138753.1 redoxin domain-containing protein [Pontibacter silvestris]